MIKHAAVTGAASGIGADCCRALLEQGWKVYGLDRSEEGLIELDRYQESTSGKFFPLQCDVSDSAAMAHAFAQIGRMTSSLDALICSAGIFRTGPLLEMTEENFDALFEINTKGAWLAAREAFPLLKRAAPGGEPAHMVFVASIAALRPKVGGGAYAASKAALTQLVRVMAVELAGQGILVNAVAPSTVDTPMTQKLAADAAHNGYKVSGMSPIGRVAQPADITSVIRFLLSSDARYVNGAILPVDGGTSAAFQPRT
ncbi:SDR family NAD(P)-dependent oxidoreductase [Pollutimonas bauzanensis]|uniref:NAD(P)-dependent dehydrogenase, short-chain alcohol dehydrogenase family n=1 Tax=Pollutimonas bauzanensis TaxID=658167 RepID=A0A1M5SHE0_9BURK|nr:SDR family oxidoreductase [Pollutimonas bauzanensis]SHH37956.1 NAD(P)-dependent dehydrogenase, short-chain alcohol dehydrogenase family [Pollutimonas bauzanensis]